MRYLQALSRPLLSPALMIPPISTIAIRTYSPNASTLDDVTSNSRSMRPNPYRRPKAPPRLLTK